ncbi:MAG: DUF3108 domain-containing protein [Bryobacteraceae bacterium]
MSRLPIAIFALASTLFAQGESLQYSISWPSGLSLGEGSISSKLNGTHRELELVLDASLPGVPVRDQYRSRIAPERFCSVLFEKESAHGARKSSEKSTFDSAKGTLVRQTKDGGKTETAVGACARDGLAFLFYVRDELSKGRIPPPQTIYFGAPYQVSLKHAGTEAITAGDTRVDADRISITVKGPASTSNFEILFARDATRTPLRIKAPLPVGTLTMDLVR